MTWSSFCEYWLLCEFDTPDAVMRNYALDRSPPKDHTAVGVCLAVKHLGFKGNQGTVYNDVKEVEARLRNMGVEAFWPLLLNRLVEWYNWHRITKGEVQQWFLREVFQR